MTEVFKRAFVKIVRREDVYLLTMSNKMNIFTLQFMSQLSDAYTFLAQKTEGPACLVTQSAIPKAFSAGLDLKHLLNHKTSPEGQNYLQTYQNLLAQLLRLPMITIAAINNHAYAGGLMLALAHDYRIMNQDQGHLCMSEIKYGIFLPPGMMSVCKHKMERKIFREIILTGEPIGPQEGKEAGFIDELHPLEKLESRAIEMAEKYAPSAQHREAITGIKFQMNEQMIDKLLNGGIMPIPDYAKPKL